ncbi:unnamed protein product [Miscanthus lutarioriparius]|uniref:Formin-like protein n=1 Tax=Miscanthus lutarioriparius TaxID=422564 RepID=A0A811R5V2_9POAL|nr:unnamed protein product [Miscanthus lutarioriparius]
MGLAVKRVFLLAASLVLLLLSFEFLEEGALRLVSHGCGEVSAVAVTRDAGSGFVTRFRMLVSLDHHHRPRHPHRSHQKSSAAAAPAPTPALAPVQVHEARAAPTPTPTPAPLPHERHRRMPLRNHSHIAPVRSVARRLGGGGHARLPTAAIVALAVAGACLLVLGVAVAAALLRRSRKLQKKPFKLFSHGLTGQLVLPSRDDSPSSSSYQSLSPDCRSPFCPKTPPFTAPGHAQVHNAFCHLPENPDEEKTEVINHQKTAKATTNSGSMGHPEAPKVDQVNAKLRHLSSGYKSTSFAIETTPSETNSAFRVSNTDINLDPKESIPNSAEEAKFKASGATTYICRFDEQMIKSLFAYNFQGPAKNEDPKSKSLSTSKHVIEHHKLQNTTILLKTLNASTEQVCSSITEGTGLSTQQLEALVKMKPSEDEEKKLLDYDGDINMLDPAENFVKVLLTIPKSFSRIEAMLYKETFDDEVAHLRMSFALIKGACSELRSSKLFLRLLEAVLKTGNRMNVGTIRGGATTLAEREEYPEIGTEFVSELSNELGNVKKVASIDLDTLKSSISNLSHGLAQLIRLVSKELNCNDRNQNFLQCMRSFQTHAENTMQELKVDEAEVLQQVRELTEYYPGEVGKNSPTSSIYLSS